MYLRKAGFGLIVVAVLSLAAVMASTAQAAEGLELKLYHLALLLKGTFLKQGQAETLTGEQEETTVLKIPAKNFELRCATSQINEASLKNEVDPGVTHIVKEKKEEKEVEIKIEEKSPSGLSAEGSGKRTFGSCKVFTESTGIENVPCTKALNEHNNAGKPVSVFDFLFLLHDSPEQKTHFWMAILKSLPAIPFTTLEFGGTCSLPEKVKIEGSVAIQISNPEVDAVKMKGVVDTGGSGKQLQEAAKAKLLFGANEAFIKGNGYVELTGAGKGSVWGVMG
jgi:hypothetical protein